MANGADARANAKASERARWAEELKTLASAPPCRGGC